MADPLELRDELERTLALAAEEATAYAVAALGRAGARARASTAGLEGLDGPLPETGAGARARGRGARRAWSRRGDAVERPAVLSLRHRRHDPGGARRRLAHLGLRPGRLRLGLVAARLAGRGGRGSLAARAVRAPRRVRRRAGHRGDDGELHRADRRPQLVGRARRASTPTTTGSPGAPPPRILSSGYVHPSAVQAVGMLGLGRANVAALRPRRRRPARPRRARRRRSPSGGPAIVIANAGEVNAGDFDPIAEMAELAREHDAWLHVDGAFGLFARLAPESRALTDGDRARRLDHRRRSQVAQRPLRLRRLVRARAGAPGAGAQHRRAVPALAPTTRARTSAS